MPHQEIFIALACLATGILLVIMALLFRINGRIATLSAQLSRTSRAAKPDDTDAETSAVEVGPGTPFDEFLKEDPARHALSKKEQFKAYRAWRSEMGLNWSAKD